MTASFSLIGWVHFVVASLSMILGASILMRAKGTPSHRKFGRWYFYALIATNITGLMIYNAFGTFFFPHWLALATLVVVLIGFWAVSRRAIKGWLVVHITCIVISYYMLIGP